MDRAKMFPRELELSEDGSLVVTVDQVRMGVVFMLVVAMMVLFMLVVAMMVLLVVIMGLERMF